MDAVTRGAAAMRPRATRTAARSTAVTGTAPLPARGAAARPARGAGHRPRRSAFVLLVGLLLAVLAGCGSEPEATIDDPEDGVIVIAGFDYEVPASVPAGAQITVRNEDGIGHTVTSDEAGLFDVTVAPGEEAVLTVPDQPGEYPFHCTPHPTMTATLVVE